MQRFRKNTWLFWCLAILLAGVTYGPVWSAARPAQTRSSEKTTKKKAAPKRSGRVSKGKATPAKGKTVTRKKTTTVRRRTVRRRRRRTRYRRVRGQRAPTRDRIQQIQAVLQREGDLNTDPDGVWGPTTADAMKKFQQDHGLDPTGKIDALTLQKLGLGSAIAGKGAPVPIASSAAPSQTPSQGSSAPKP